MDRTTIEDAVFPDCPIRNILARLCDKWSLLVLYTLNKAGSEPVRLPPTPYQFPDSMGPGKHGPYHERQEDIYQMLQNQLIFQPQKSCGKHTLCCQLYSQP